MTEGVTNLRRTSSQKAWQRAGRLLQTRDAAAATSASPVAQAALFRPRRNSSSTARLPSLWIARGLGLALLAQEIIELLDLISRQWPRADQVHEQGRHGAATKLIGHALEAPADQLIAINPTGEDQDAISAGVADETLPLEPAQQVLHGGIMRLATLGVKGIGDLAAGGAGPRSRSHAGSPAPCRLHPHWLDDSSHPPRHIA